MNVRPSFVPFAADEEHLARRMATALLLQWNAVPIDLRQRIVDQAGLVEDAGVETVQLREQLDAFVRKFAAAVA